MKNMDSKAIFTEKKEYTSYTSSPLFVYLKKLLCLLDLNFLDNYLYPGTRILDIEYPGTWILKVLSKKLNPVSWILYILVPVSWSYYHRN